MIRFVLFSAFFLHVTTVQATTYFNTPPFSFVQGVPGDTCITNPAACAKSSEVNANFQQLVTNGNAGYIALKAQVDAVSGSGAPTGAVIAVNSVTCPPGFIISDGNSGSPDARGVYVRGLDLGAGIDPSRALATYQDDQFQTHGHSDFSVVTALTGSVGITGGPSNFITALTGSSSHTDTTSTTPTETRPDTVVLLYCYKKAP